MSQRGMERPLAERVVFELDIEVRQGGPSTAPALLSGPSGLSKSRIKEAMLKGAVWRHEAGRKPERLRRASAPLRPGDRVALYYDSQVLDSEPPQAALLEDQRRYSLWWKPAGLMVEGSQYGDHATLKRQAELALKREVLLPHRLDREAQGLMLLAHTRQAAARLGALFRERQIRKVYHIEVRGDLQALGREGSIDLPLDGKAASTRYRVDGYDPARNASRVEVSMATGRNHQIRRHFALIGHPVLGDPRYGQDNADPRGLQLSAVELGFRDPWTGEERSYRLDQYTPISR